MHEDLVSDKWHAALFIKKEAKASISKRTKREKKKLKQGRNAIYLFFIWNNIKGKILPWNKRVCIKIYTTGVHDMKDKEYHMILPFLLA